METRSFTDEELSQPITLERINEYHREVGEDFTDQQSIGNPTAFGGYLLAKHPDKSELIVRLLNDRPDMLALQEVFGEEGTDESSDAFYTEYCEYINYTTYSKAEVNKVLLSAKEHYKY